jgi:hypothetical protein
MVLFLWRVYGRGTVDHPVFVRYSSRYFMTVKWKRVDTRLCCGLWPAADTLHLMELCRVALYDSSYMRC